MKVDIHYAKLHLAKLIEQAESGEEVLIVRADKPVVQLVALSARAAKQTLLGCGVGKLWISEDFASGETDREIAKLFENGDREVPGRIEES
jgi:antitoxin (DNA-binding transcriptional repressor) of toxin-antitoxin stability system